MKPLRLLLTFVLIIVMLCAAPVEAAEEGCWHLEWFGSEAADLEMIDVVIDEEGGVMLLWPDQTVSSVVVDYLI